jgi:hypothetical protein
MARACSSHGELRNTYKILVRNLKGRPTLEDIGINERIILKWFLGR